MAANSPPASALRRPCWATAGRDPVLCKIPPIAGFRVFRHQREFSQSSETSLASSRTSGADVVVATGLLPPLEESALAPLVENLLSFLRLNELAQIGQVSHFWAPRGSRRQTSSRVPATPTIDNGKKSEEDTPFAERMGSLRAPGWLSGRRSRTSLNSSPWTPLTDKVVKKETLAMSPTLPQVLTFDDLCRKADVATKILCPDDDWQRSNSKILEEHLDTYVQSVSDEIRSPQQLGLNNFETLQPEGSYERPVCELVRIMTDRKVNLGSGGEGQLDGLCSELCSRLRSSKDRANGWKNVQPSEVAAIAEMLSSVAQSRLLPGSTVAAITSLLDILEAFCCIGGVARLLENDKLLILLRELLLRLHDQSWLPDVQEKNALLRRFNVATVELLHAVGAEASVDVLIELWLQEGELSSSSILPKCLHKVGSGLLKRKQNPRRQVEAMFVVLQKYVPRLPNKPTIVDVLREFANTVQQASPEGANAWLDRRMCGRHRSALTPVESAIFRDILMQQENLIKHDSEKDSGQDHESNISDDILCVVCLNSKRNVVFRPCNHLAVCSTCSEAAATSACPLCRAPVTERLMIYL